MTDPNTNKDKRRKWGSGVELVLPIRPLRKVGTAFQELGAACRDLSGRFRSGLPDVPQGQKFEEGDPRGISDSQRRFTALYDANKWTGEELAQQLVAIRRSKLTAMIMTAVAFAGALASLAMLPIYMLLLVLPVSGCLVILGLVQWLRFALYEAQIELRSLLSARDFACRDDFFHRLIK
jgi:hypothetical protein